MNRPIFISHRTEFNRKNDAIIDMAQGRMAMHIEVAIKTSAGTPVKTGGMKSEVRHFRAANHKFRVEAGKEYSAVQELGRRAGAAVFSHYTTAGTHAGWFKRAIDTVVPHKAEYYQQAVKAVGL